MNMPTCTSHAPWRAEFGLYGWAVLSARGEEVAFIRQSIVHDEANARLIASAPELLASLEAITKAYVELIKSDYPPSWNAEKDEEVISAREVIARAKGLQ